MAVKKTNKALIITVASVVIIGAGLFFLLRKRKKDGETDKSLTGTTGGTGTGGTGTGGSEDNTNKSVDTPKKEKVSIWSPIGTSADNLKYNEPIVYGAKGEEVVKLQTLLNGYLKTIRKNPIKVDGDFGKSTWDVVRTIEQKAKSLNWWNTFFINYANALKKEIEKYKSQDVSQNAPKVDLFKVEQPSSLAYLPSYKPITFNFIGDNNTQYEPTSSFAENKLDL
jgi:hypothetical protein